MYKDSETLQSLTGHKENPSPCKNPFLEVLPSFKYLINRVGRCVIWVFSIRDTSYARSRLKLLGTH